MSKILLHPTETAHWHSLVCEAEQAAHHFLDEELQSYLVFMLMRYLAKPQIASSIVALDYIKGMHASGNAQYETLRDVGDTCLLHAGLFPERSIRRRVTNDYYVEMGCGAYLKLAEAISHGFAKIYGRLSTDFVGVMSILQSMREMGGSPIPDNLRAHNLDQLAQLEPLSNQESGPELSITKHFH